MKKIVVAALIVSSMALAACGKKKAPDAPTGGSATPAGSDMGSAAGSGDTTPPAGSDAPAGGGSAM